MPVPPSLCAMVLHRQTARDDRFKQTKCFLFCFVPPAPTFPSTAVSIVEAALAMQRYLRKTTGISALCTARICKPQLHQVTSSIKFSFVIHTESIVMLSLTTTCFILRLSLTINMTKKKEESAKRRNKIKDKRHFIAHCRG